MLECQEIHIVIDVVALCFAGSPLKPLEVGLFPKENSHAHHTDEYECEELVLRRGQEFDLSVTFDRKFNADTDSVVLQFIVGS